MAEEKNLNQEEIDKETVPAEQQEPDTNEEPVEDFIPEEFSEDADAVAAVAAPVTEEYDENQIQVLEGLDAVRKRPGMYIGTTSARGLHHLVYEIVDNSIDEALAGFCDTITVTINPDESVTVEDNGRGIPTGMHEKGIPTPEVVFMILHAGGKFGGGGYKIAGGLHGVGASVVNALSEWVELDDTHEGVRATERFERGHVARPYKLVDPEPGREHGLRVTFKPDPTIFETTKFEYDILLNRLREQAFLNAGVHIVLRDNRGEEPRDRFTVRRRNPLVRNLSEQSAA